jgi:Fe-S-cluster containining protein
MSDESDDCRCEECQAACKRKPGWFKPGEAEKAADLLGMPLPEFFRKYIAVDFWVAEPPVFVLSPATVDGATGTEFPFAPEGQCVFFKDGLCDIHAAKPHECRAMRHDRSFDGVHEATMKTWEGEPQAQIESLLERKPEMPEMGFGDVFGLLRACCEAQKLPQSKTDLCPGA